MFFWEIYTSAQLAQEDRFQVSAVEQVYIWARFFPLCVCLCFVIFALTGAIPVAEARITFLRGGIERSLYR